MERNSSHQKPANLTGAAVSELVAALDPARVQDFLRRLLHPGETTPRRCLQCESPLSDRLQATYQAWRPVRCSACGRKFSVASGTILEGAHLSPPEVFLVAALVELGVPPAGVARALGRSYMTAASWCEKVRGKND